MCLFVFESFDTDPTTRHTVWTMIVGGYFTWISVYGINQTQVQRYLTVKEKSQAVKYVLVAERISVVSTYMYGHYITSQLIYQHTFMDY